MKLLATGNSVYLSMYYGIRTNLALFVFHRIMSLFTKSSCGPWAPAGGSKGERSLPPRKKKKKSLKKKCTN